MFRWCSYCQKYIGTKPPYQDHSLTHGICLDCKSTNKIDDEEALKSIGPLREFYKSLVQIGKESALDEIPEALRKAKTLGIQNTDIIMGMMTPLLYEVGCLWENGQFTVADEHRVTQTCEEVVREIRKSYDFKTKDQNLDGFLVNVEGNYHVIGLQILQILFKDKGKHFKTLLPGTPAEDIVKMLQSTPVPIIGISISLSKDKLNLIQLINQIKKNCSFVQHILVGGYAVTTDSIVSQDLPQEAVLVKDPMNLNFSFL